MAVEDQIVTERCALYLGDCCEVLPALPDDSVHLSVYSPPFAGLYHYSSSEHDLSNCQSHDQFLAHYSFVVREIARVTMPGRLTVVHCMDLVRGTDLTDLPGDIVRLHEAAGFVYHDRKTIWKEPLKVAMRTRALGLRHSQIVKDASLCRSALADYLLVFRKKGANPVPIGHAEGLTQYAGADAPPEDLVARYRNWRDPKTNKLSHWIWRRYASSVWMDVRVDRVLPYREARESEEEKHVHPLQLDTIDRCVALWSNPGEKVLTPFMGVGSEVYAALRAGRRGLGIELKPSYFRQAVKNVEMASLPDSEQIGLFDDLEGAGAGAGVDGEALDESSGEAKAEREGGPTAPDFGAPLSPEAPDLLPAPEGEPAGPPPAIMPSALPEPTAPDWPEEEKDRDGGEERAAGCEPGAPAAAAADAAGGEDEEGFDDLSDPFAGDDISRPVYTFTCPECLAPQEWEEGQPLSAGAYLQRSCGDCGMELALAMTEDEVLVLRSPDAPAARPDVATITDTALAAQNLEPAPSAPAGAYRVARPAEPRADGVGSDATLDGPYRYRLSRVWGDLTKDGVALFVMLNPSTADHEQDDPTIRRCMAFARSWGYAGVEVVNLYAYQATEPKDLQSAIDADGEAAAVGPENDAHIREASARARVVIAAWGAAAAGFAAGRARTVIDDVLSDRALFCLGTTDGGHPRHPLYVKGEARPLAFAPICSPQAAPGGPEAKAAAGFFSGASAGTPTAAPAAGSTEAAAEPAADPLYLPHAERGECPPEVAQIARTLGYDCRAALPMIRFVRAAEALESGRWARIVTKPRDCPAPGPNLFTADKKSPERFLCPVKAARLANLILRGAASDKPALTAERWDAATVRLPLFARVVDDAYVSGWDCAETLHVVSDPEAAVRAAFPDDWQPRDGDGARAPAPDAPGPKEPIL